jgi:hypothetical protein
MECLFVSATLIEVSFILQTHFDDFLPAEMCYSSSRHKLVTEM